MRKFIALMAIVLISVSCWNDIKGTLIDAYSGVLATPVSTIAGCQVPNTVVQPWLASEFDKVLKVNRGLKKEAKRLAEMEDDAKKSGLESDEQKGLVNLLCKTAVSHIAPVLANRGEKFPAELQAIGCKKEKLYLATGDLLCSFAPAHFVR